MIFLLKQVVLLIVIAQVIVHSVFILILGQYVHRVANVTSVMMVPMEHVDHAGKASQRENPDHVQVNTQTVFLYHLTLFELISRFH